MTLRLLYIVSCITVLSGTLAAQTSCIPTNLNGTVINLPCGVNCTDLKFKVPHLKSTETYTVNSVPYAPYAYTTTTGNELPNLYTDDKFSDVINLPFNFCFYNDVYSKFVIGSNGVITFDASNAAPCENAFKVTVPIPYAAGTQCLLSSVYYPRASIMLPYSDLDPQTASNPADRKIEWRVEGTAPCRRLIVSYYHVATYGFNNGCSSAINTFQAVIYESTGLIDVFIQDKPLCTVSTSGGNAILGLQNWAQDQAIAAPGKNATAWSATNEGYRFTPNGNTSRFVKAELWDINGNVIKTTGPADTSTTTQGLLDISFLNICPTTGSTRYVVKTYFSSCSNSVDQLFSTDTVTINKNLNATVTSTATACSASSGTITVTVPTGNGTPPYEYSLDGNPFILNPATVFINQSAGNHTMVVRDASGCTSDVITVNVPTGTVITGSTSSTPTSCDGAGNGTITVSATNGVGPYTYSLDGAGFQIFNLYSNVTAGNHTIVIKDAAGCLSSVMSVVVAAGARISGTATSTPTTCPGINNGTVNVNSVSAGVNNPVFSLDNGAFQSMTLFTNVAAGVHFVIVRDMTGCLSLPISVTVGQGVSVTGSATSTATSCNGASNGTVTAVPTPGSGIQPYQYSLDGGSFQIFDLFSNVSSGSHYVVIMDAAGCKTTNIPVVVPAGAPITGTATSTAATCSGLQNGTITVTVMGNFTTTQYSLDGNPLQNAHVFTGVAPGTHSVVIYDGTGCISAPIPVTVAQGPQVSTTLTTTPTSCNGAANGIVTVVPPTNGTPPYLYSLNNGPLQLSNVFTGLKAGTYLVFAVDAGGCNTGLIQAIVSSGAPLTATLSKTDADCNGSATGSITVTISTSATPPFEYSLDGTNYQTSNVFNNLPAGTYTVFFRESNGCSGTQSITVNQPTLLSATLSAQPVVCNGQGTGLITVSATGGTSPYQYSLTGVSYQAGNTFNVGAGSFTVYIKDSRGCIQTRTISVTEPPPVLLNIVSTGDASCNGGSDGSITVSASGGNSPYRFSSDGVNFQASNVLNVGPGSFTVIAKDNGGCNSAPATVTVGLTNNLTITPMRDTVICEGKSVQLNSITNATRFAWAPAGSLTGSTTASPVASPTVTTQYIVTATFGRCAVNDTVIVNVLAAPVADAGPDGNICFGQSYQLQGSGGVTYQWVPSTSLSSNSIPDPVVTPASSTQYFLNVIDANNCRSVNPDIVNVNVTPPIVIKTFPVDTVVSEGDQVQLLAFSLGTTYSWTPVTGLNNPSIANPVATVTTDITYRVETTTAAGCKGEAFVVFHVYKGPDLYVPSGFTPNGDGKNDRFKPFPVGIKELKYFRVYNRWGQIVFSTSTLNAGWDGKFGSREEPSGVYVWAVEGITKEGKVISKKGTVVLIR